METQNSHSKVLKQAAVEPVLLTAELHLSYVMMSIESYEKLLDRLPQLEKLVIGRQTEAALSNA